MTIGYEPDELDQISPEMIEAGVNCLEESGYLTRNHSSAALELLVRQLLSDSLRASHQAPKPE